MASVYIPAMIGEYDMHTNMIIVRAISSAIDDVHQLPRDGQVRIEEGLIRWYDRTQ